MRTSLLLLVAGLSTLGSWGTKMSDEVRLIGLRDRAALDPVRLVGVRPPVGVGGGVLSRSVAGLLHADGFDSDTTGDYTFSTNGTGPVVAVTGGRLRLTPQNTKAINAQVNGISVGKTFAQITTRYQHASLSYSALLLRAAGFGTWTLSIGVTDGFSGYSDTSVPGIKTQIMAGSAWGAAVNAGTPGFVINTDYISQLFVDDDLQEMWHELNDTKVQATEAGHNGQNSRGVGFYLQMYNATYGEFDDAIYMKDRSFVCTGVPGGHQLKIYDSGDVELFAATEAGGTATIADVSKYANVANPTVPLAGWAYATIETASDVEIARYDALGVYPGDQYGYSA